jgi:hypothetical protein
VDVLGVGDHAIKVEKHGERGHQGSRILIDRGPFDGPIQLIIVKIRFDRQIVDFPPLPI